jgi:hypothetical protein
VVVAVVSEALITPMLVVAEVELVVIELLLR